MTFVVGAITGTVLSFEMGLLWPEFMRRFGDVFGLPFALEGIFFFTEAIFIAIYIYGWKHLSGVGAFLDRRPGGARGARRCVVGRGGKLVDEPAGRVQARGGRDGNRRATRWMRSSTARSRTRRRT